MSELVLIKRIEHVENSLKHALMTFEKERPQLEKRMDRIDSQLQVLIEKMEAVIRVEMGIERFEKQGNDHELRLRHLERVSLSGEVKVDTNSGVLRTVGTALLAGVVGLIGYYLRGV